MSRPLLQRFQHEDISRYHIPRKTQQKLTSRTEIKSMTEEIRETRAKEGNVGDGSDKKVRVRGKEREKESRGQSQILISALSKR